MAAKNHEAESIARDICLRACMFKLSPHDWSEIAVNLHDLAERFRNGETPPNPAIISPELVTPVVDALTGLCADMNDKANWFGTNA